jgi:hypothetical protein
MSNSERSALVAPESTRFSQARRIKLVAEVIHSSGAARANPFASFAASEAGPGREMNAATKVYEVPRELIEIARARANGAEPAGKTTPLAPRPDAELEATLRAYTARLSTKPPRVPSALLEEAVAEDVSASRSEAPPLAAEPNMAKPNATEPAAVREPEPLLLERPMSARPSANQGAPLVRARRPARESQAWMVYAALSLLGLASCAHVLLAP